jgi:hypothetical protein
MRSRTREWVLSALLLATGTWVQGEGIPEPNLVLYGVVNNTSAGGGRVSFGKLTWIFEPADGAPAITLETTLTNINDQFSYVLRVPLETELPGIAVSPGALKLAAVPSRYTRSKITIDGTSARLVQPDLASLVLARTDRGRIERIDLAVGVDTSGGLPEAWQIQYFGRTGVDPNADADQDGLSNLAEFKLGTNPTDAQSLFEIMDVQVSSGGATIEWSSAANKFYTLQRSAELMGGFTNLRTRIAATAPVNTHQDTTATGAGPFFYRVLLEE